MKPNTTIKYFLYARKSSESEDRQVASIEAQIHELEKIAQNEGLHVAHIFQESRSAKAPGRPVFNEMIGRLQKGEASGILCWKLNRLARNPIDGSAVQWMIQQGGLQHIQTYGRSYYPSDNVIVMAVELGMANQFVRDLSTDTKRGLRAKAESGWLPTHAPVGYTNNKYEDKGRKSIVKDSERFPIVRMMWDLLLTGLYSVSKIHEIATNDWGFRMKSGRPMSLSKMYYLFNNTFYHGPYDYAGIHYPDGKQEKMITKEEFDRAQIILGNKSRPRPQSHEFAYTGLIRCGECNSMITAEEKTKRQKNGNTHHYTYYRCTKKKDRKCTQGYVEVNELEKQIAETLLSIDIPPEFHEWALEVYKSDNAKEARVRDTILSNQQKAYAICLKQIDELIDMRAGKEITAEEFSKKKELLLANKAHLQELQNDTDTHVTHWLENAEEKLNFADSIYDRFNATDDLKEKRQALADIGSNLILKDKKLTLEIEKPLLKIKQAADTAKQENDRLGPPDNLYSIKSFEEIYTKFPVMGAYRDLNPR